MQENSLHQLYVEQLKDLYSAETQLTKALPKMAKAARSPELREGFQKHLEQTKGHVERLEQIFSALDESPKGRKCAGMEGLVQEGDEVAKEESSSAALDAGLIAAAQRVEHYEIAGYGTVHAFAELLGEEDAASLLQQTLDEEKETNQKLSELSQDINAQAMASGESEAAQQEEEEGAPTRNRKQGKTRAARA
jgi:ferritin-like metal-binding protein YciE